MCKRKNSKAGHCFGVVGNGEYVPDLQKRGHKSIVPVCGVEWITFRIIWFQHNILFVKISCVV